MNEEKQKKEFRIGVLLCVTAAILVTVASVYVLNSLYHSRNDLVREQMRAEVVDYSDRITRQIDKDFQTLHTLASFIRTSGMEENPNMARILQQANYKNEFVSMGYFNKDGIGDLAHLQYGIKEKIDYRKEFNKTVVEAMDKAYGGKEALSRLFESDVSRKKVYVYCVPLLKNGEVEAVLCASDNVEIFDAAIGEKTVMSGNGVIHLLSRKGEVLLSSKRYKEKTGIFSEQYFSKKGLKQIDEVMNGKRKDAIVTLNYDGKKYVACLNTLQVNDWYLLLVHDSTTANRAADYVIKTMILTFVILLTIVLCLLFFIYRLMSRNNRHLMQIAYKDWLTGADNMMKFEKNCSEVLDKETAFSIAAINIRQFKFINEIFGKEVGDDLLRTISRKLGEAVREGEFFARETADMFYLHLLSSEEKEIQNRLENLFSQLVCLGCQEKRDYQLQMYAGVYIHKEGMESGDFHETIMPKVSFALEQCKRQPGKVIAFYDADIHRGKEKENYAESYMAQALADEEFRVFLQPKVNLNDGSLAGAEALVRWITKDGSMVYPDVFIPLFERNGFCVQLDLYMVRQVCRLLRKWIDAGIRPIPISVNQTKLLFYQADYLDRLKECLDEFQIPAELITLEILEGLALEHKEEMNRKLRSLREMGFKISMDDFGTGYASFNTLGNLEIDELKLDRSFLLGISRDQSYRFYTIMSGVIDLSKRLYISTVAEGVETKEEEEMIRSMGCDLGQGYLYSRPISAEEFFEKYMVERKEG